jgi:hypothetical protein
VELFLAASVVAAAILAAGLIIAWRAAASIERMREDTINARRAQLLLVFAPALAAAADDPRSLIAWQPLAVMARKLLPVDFAELDAAAGTTFPFSKEQIHAAHARWSAEWLAWEAAHDAEYKLKAAALEEDISASGGSALARARLDSVEREKLGRYQRRYEEYTRVSKALKGLADRC